MITEDYVLKNGDYITHQTIRNEPPVLYEEIKIIH